MSSSRILFGFHAVIARLRTRPQSVHALYMTGVRHDAYANAHRIPTESAKLGKENGRYLYPELFGKPLALSIARLFGGK